MTDTGQRTEHAHDRTPDQGERTIDTDTDTDTDIDTDTDTAAVDTDSHTADGAAVPTEPGTGGRTAPAPAVPETTSTAHEPTRDETAALLSRLSEHIEDLSRVVARQAATIERLADEAKARDRRERAGADLPLVTELFALHGDTVTCAHTAESDRDRDAFTALATRVERLLTGRGATLVA